MFSFFKTHWIFLIFTIYLNRVVLLTCVSQVNLLNFILVVANWKEKLQMFSVNIFYMYSKNIEIFKLVL